MRKEEFITFLKNNRSEDIVKFRFESIENVNSSLSQIKNDHIVFERNDVARSVFLVLFGKIKLKKAFGEDFKTVMPGEVFGMDALFKMGRRKLNAIASESTSLLEIFLEDSFKLELPVKKIESPTADINYLDIYTDDLRMLDIKRNLNMNFEFVRHKKLAVVFVNLVKATLTNSKRFNDFLGNLINNGEKQIIVDLRACKLVDSTFMGAIVRCHKLTNKLDGKIVLVYNKDNPTSLFMITCMDRVFHTYNDLPAAISHYELENSVEV